MERECIDNGVLDRGCWMGSSTCCSNSRDCSSATVRCNVSAYKGVLEQKEKGGIREEEVTQERKM